MKVLNKGLCIYVCFAALVGCDQFRDKSDIGYSDGYAVGYNTTCEIRATLVEGDWRNKSYSQGYDRGYIDGANACRTSK
jgi:hypothetical protein